MEEEAKESTMMCKHSFIAAGVIGGAVLLTGMAPATADDGVHWSITVQAPQYYHPPPAVVYPYSHHPYSAPPPVQTVPGPFLQPSPYSYLNPQPVYPDSWQSQPYPQPRAYQDHSWREPQWQQRDWRQSQQQPRDRQGWREQERGWHAQREQQRDWRAREGQDRNSPHGERPRFDNGLRQDRQQWGMQDRRR
jgi:hypothetical protein